MSKKFEQAKGMHEQKYKVFMDLPLYNKDIDSEYGAYLSFGEYANATAKDIINYGVIIELLNSGRIKDEKAAELFAAYKKYERFANKKKSEVVLEKCMEYQNAINEAKKELAKFELPIEPTLEGIIQTHVKKFIGEDTDIKIPDQGQIKKA